MHIGAKRVFRLSLSVALSLAVAYGSGMSLPYLAPLFAFMLGAAPKPPMGPKSLLGLLLALSVMLGVGLLLIPMLQHYPATGLILVLLGLFVANYVSLNLGKAPVGALLTVGIAMISAVGLVGYGVAVMLISAMLLSIAVAVIIAWVVYPLFPEDGPPPEPPAKPEPLQSSWLSLRATLIVFPSYLLALTNPGMYMPIIMKSVALGQQASETDAKQAGAELIGSTCVAGLLAALFWVLLKLHPSLWMFFLWTLLFSLYMTAKLYGVLASRFSPSFWQNVMITLFILIGPAVEDSANGKDPYSASLVRISLFIGVTLYAWMALRFLDRLRAKQEMERRLSLAIGETN